jgi:hypothetical protein
MSLRSSAVLTSLLALGAGAIGYWVANAWGDESANATKLSAEKFLPRQSPQTSHAAEAIGWLESLQQEGGLAGETIRLLEKIPVPEIAAALELLRQRPLAPEDQVRAAKILWRRWADAEPEAAVAAALKEPSVGQTRWGLICVFQALARQGFPQVERYLPLIAECPEKLAIQMAMRSVLAQSHPDALALLPNLVEKPSYDKDPNYLRSQEFHDLGAKDPLAAVERFLALPEHLQESNLLLSSLENWPPQADAELLALHQKLINKESLSLVEQCRTRMLAKVNLADAVTWIASLPEDRRANCAKLIREQLLLGDPALAVRWLVPSRSPHDYEPLYFRESPGRIADFVKQHPAEARAWIDQFPSGALQVDARVAYLTELAKINLAGAREFIQSNADQARFIEVFRLMKMSANDYRDLIEGLPETLRSQAVSAKILEAWQHRWYGLPQRPEQYAALLPWVQLSSDLPEAEREMFYTQHAQTVYQAALQNPQQTMDWVLRQPAAAGDVLFRNAWSAWVQQSDREAMAWMESKPQFPWKEQAYLETARILLQHDPTRAAEVLAKMETVPENSRSQLQHLISQIREYAPGAISQSLEQRLLPENSFPK